MVMLPRHKTNLKKFPLNTHFIKKQSCPLTIQAAICKFHLLASCPIKQAIVVGTGTIRCLFVSLRDLSYIYSSFHSSKNSSSKLHKKPISSNRCFLYTFWKTTLHLKRFSAYLPDRHALSYPL
jgi:hypothetical protein